MQVDQSALLEDAVRQDLEVVLVKRQDLSRGRDARRNADEALTVADGCLLSIAPDALAHSWERALKREITKLEEILHQVRRALERDETSRLLYLRWTHVLSGDRRQGGERNDGDEREHQRRDAEARS